MTWLLLGKLPSLIALLVITLMTARRFNWQSALIATTMMCSSFVLGIIIIPSIIGALLISILAHTLTLRFLFRDFKAVAKHSFGSITSAFAGLLFIGRIGCWLAGCCFGMPYEGLGATSYQATELAYLHYFELDQLNHSHLTETGSVSVHAVQLYEACLVGFISLICLFLYRQPRQNDQSHIRFQLNELQASFAFWALYLLVRAGIDPLRGMVNTLSSLDICFSLGTIDISYFQVLCLGIGFVFLLALRFIPDLPNQCQKETQAQLKMRTPDLVETWVYWLMAWGAVWLSSHYGTPFSHLLAYSSAWCLTGFFATVAYREFKLQTQEIHFARVKGFDLSKQKTFQLGLNLTLLCLTFVGMSAMQGLDQRLIAEPFAQELLSEKQQRAWVYVLDPLTQKRGRLSRVSELNSFLDQDFFEFSPLSKLSEGEIQVVDLDQESIDESFHDKKSVSKHSARSRLRLKLLAGQLKFAREDVCGGSTAYSISQAALEANYLLTSMDWFDLSLDLGGAYNKVKVIDNEYITSPAYLDDTQTHFLGSFGLQLENRFLRGNIGMLVPFGLANFSLGGGFSNLTESKGFSFFVDVGLGSPYLNTTVVELYGLFAKADMKKRLNKDVDLIFNFSIPAPNTSLLSFGVGLRINMMEFRFDITNAPLGHFPGYGYIQYGR